MVINHVSKSWDDPPSMNHLAHDVQLRFWELHKKLGECYQADLQMASVAWSGVFVLGQQETLENELGSQPKKSEGLGEMMFLFNCVIFRFHEKNQECSKVCQIHVFCWVVVLNIT